MSFMDLRPASNAVAGPKGSATLGARRFRPSGCVARSSSRRGGTTTMILPRALPSGPNRSRAVRPYL